MTDFFLYSLYDFYFFCARTIFLHWNILILLFLEVNNLDKSYILKKIINLLTSVFVHCIQWNSIFYWLSNSDSLSFFVFFFFWFWSTIFNADISKQNTNKITNLFSDSMDIELSELIYKMETRIEAFQKKHIVNFLEGYSKNNPQFKQHTNKQN